MDIQKYSEHFFASLQTYSWLLNLKSRKSLGSTVLVKNIKLILLVFKRSILPNTSIVPSAWYMQLFDCILNMVKESLEPQYVPMFMEVLMCLKEETVDETMVASLVSIIPHFCANLAILDKQQFASCIHLLLQLSPAVYSLLQDYILYTVIDFIHE